MKAVLMNSADKIEDYPEGDPARGALLLMEKTIYKRDGIHTWLDSDAHSTQSIPLDDELGTGQLNASRALTQFISGEWNPPQPSEPFLPLIGWDYGLSGGVGQIKKYPLDLNLWGGSQISITLVWDREVILNDTVVPNFKWDVGETFTVSPLENLDLYLMPRGATDLSQKIWSSVSTLYNVEHIFFQLPGGDAPYEIWVRHTGGVLSQMYALAWWATCPPPGAMLVPTTCEAVGPLAFPGRTAPTATSPGQPRFLSNSAADLFLALNGIQPLAEPQFVGGQPASLPHDKNVISGHQPVPPQPETPATLRAAQDRIFHPASQRDFSGDLEALDTDLDPFGGLVVL
jgi:hypothetical protein